MLNNKTNRTDTPVNEHDQASPSTSKGYNRVNTNTAIGGKEDTVLHILACDRKGFSDKTFISYSDLIKRNADGIALLLIIQIV